MTKYREILRLKSLGFSERNIAQSAGVSRNTDEELLEDVDDSTTPVSDLTEMAEDEDSQKSYDTGEGSFEGTSDPNIPAPLDEDTNDEKEEAMEKADGVTNEEAEMGW